MAEADPTDRDDFTRTTKDVIARRVGYHCSCCGRGTVGPNDDPTRANNLGVAAHITAASRGGPRYDAVLTREERSDARNGIWCCQNCAKEIDNDPRRYPVAVLLELRARAEQAADDRLHVVSTQGTAVTNSEATVRLAAGVILRGWRDVLSFDQSRLVELDLQEYRRDADTTSLPAWTLAQLAEGLKESRTFVLRGEPGAGKTITLLQLAGLMAADATAPIPLVFSVSGWVSSGRDLVSYATEQLSNQGQTVADVRLLLRAGRLAFLLNGWNEAGDEERARAEVQLRELLRNHPGTPLLLSTRVTQATPSFAGETSIDVRRLTQNKKAAIVRASGVAEAERLITQIESSATLAEITDTPLFLAATIRLAGAGGDIPTTRSRLLLRCVEELENADEHRAMLQAAPCHGYHRKYLAELAAAMTRRGRTTLSATEAEDAIAACTRRLRESGHLGQSGSAQAILAALVRLHLLVLPPGGAGNCAFVHEQFQERSAADWVLSRLRELTAANLAPEILNFQSEILNAPRWRVPLIFAMEELGDGDPAQGGQLVRWMMNVDLVAAAELAGAGRAPVWTTVGRELGIELRRWHARVDGEHQACATAAMVATGLSDFADLLWPMLTGDDQNVFHLLRSWDPFDMAVLGPDWAQRAARLPAQHQEIILGELSRRPSRDDLAFMGELAANGISSAVKHAALEALIYRRRYHEALAAINATSFGPWQAETYLLLTRMPREQVTPFVTRLSAALAQEADLPTRHGIIAALRKADAPGWIDLVKGELSTVLAARRRMVPWENPAEPGATGRLRTSLDNLLSKYASMIRAADAPWFYGWLASEEAGELIWEAAFIEHLPQLPEGTRVRLAESVLRAPFNGYALNNRIRAVAESGSVRVAGVVLDAYLATGDGGEQRRDLRSLLGEIPIAALVAAVVARASTATDFNTRHALIEALAYGRDGVKPTLTPAQQTALRQLVRAAADSIPADTGLRPSIHGHLARFLGRIGTADDIPLITTWAQEEVSRWEAIRRANDAARERGAQRALERDRDRSWWGHFYVESLVMLGGPEAEAVLRSWLARGEFCNDAAKGLVQLCRQEGLLPPAPPPHQRSVAITQTTPFVPGAVVRSRADAIYAAARDIPAARPGSGPKEMGLALALLNDPRALELLLAAPTEHSGWMVGEALHVMATYGATLPGRAIADALEPFFAKGEDPASVIGHDPWYGIAKGLAVMLASDTPSLAIDRMRRLPAIRREDSDARQLFGVLAGCPKPEAGAYLVELSRTLQATARSWPDLIEALGSIEDPACRARLLEMAVTPAPGVAQTHGTSLRREFVRAAKSDPGFAAALHLQLQSMDTAARTLYIHTLSELESEAAMLALLDLADLRPVAEILEHMVRGVTLSQVPAGYSGAYHLVPRAVNQVRLKLAALLVSETGVHRQIAVRLLVAIQKQRIEYGQPMDESLHPDAALIPQLRGPWCLKE